MPTYTIPISEATYHHIRILYQCRNARWLSAKIWLVRQAIVLVVLALDGTLCMDPAEVVLLFCNELDE